jgi:hypothetical protein
MYGRLNRELSAEKGKRPGPKIKLDSVHESEIAERLDVLPRDVVDTADRWPAAKRAVRSAFVVVAEPV